MCTIIEPNADILPQTPTEQLHLLLVCCIIHFANQIKKKKKKSQTLYE